MTSKNGTLFEQNLMQPKSPAILYNKNNNKRKKKGIIHTMNVIHAMVVNFCRQDFLRLGLIKNPPRHYRFLVSLPFFFPFFLSFGNSSFVNFSSSVMIESI